MIKPSMAVQLSCLLQKGLKQLVIFRLLSPSHRDPPKPKIINYDYYCPSATFRLVKGAAPYAMQAHPKLDINHREGSPIQNCRNYNTRAEANEVVCTRKFLY